MLPVLLVTGHRSYLSLPLPTCSDKGQIFLFSAIKLLELKRPLPPLGSPTPSALSAASRCAVGSKMQRRGRAEVRAKGNLSWAISKVLRCTQRCPRSCGEVPSCNASLALNSCNVWKPKKPRCALCCNAWHWSPSVGMGGRSRSQWRA